VPELFTCPGCSDVYQAHWLEPDGSGLCRSCAASRDGRCYSAGHPDHASPCSGPAEDAGGPCRYCGKPIAAAGQPCPDCTASLDSMPLAGIKALFAGDEALTIGGLGRKGRDGA
jgi:hypothetical protein